SYSSYRHPSPGDFSTPTSATFSTNQSSPRWSAMASPTSAHSRSQSMFTDSRAPGRRLSLHSSAHPFQGPPGAVVNHGVMAPPGINASSGSGFSPASTVITSPTTSGWGSRRESVSSTSAQEEAWRRRTWHPDSRNFNAPTSTLNSVANSENIRSEEHTSELQSRENLVCRLLLEKKKTT